MQLQNKIESLIIDAINKLSTPTSAFEVSRNVFKIPEDLHPSELVDNPASLKLAVYTNTAPRDAYVASGYGVRIDGAKPYATFSFRERGILTTAAFPWKLTPGSREVNPISGVSVWEGFGESWPTATDMEESMSGFRRGYTLRDPDKTTDCTVRVEWKSWDCPLTGGFGAFGRPIATINTLLKGYGLPTLDTTAGNDLLGAISAAAKGESVVVSWWDGAISELYSNERSSRQDFISCMKGQDSTLFEIYDDLQHKGTLRMLLVHKGSNTDEGYHIGRALVWSGENPPDQYIDRIYCESSSSSSDPRPDIVAAISEFCKAEGIQKTVYDQTARLIPWLMKTGLRVKSRFYYDNYPYVDSLRYLYDDGWMSTSSDRGYDMRELNSTEGQYEGHDEIQEDLVECACGTQYPESEVQYSEARGESYHVGEVVWVDTSNSYIPDIDVVRIDGVRYDHERDDVVELRDGDYALCEDAVELPDGDYVLRIDAHENKDGTWSVNP